MIGTCIGTHVKCPLDGPGAGPQETTVARRGQKNTPQKTGRSLAPSPAAPAVPAPPVGPAAFDSVVSDSRIGRMPALPTTPDGDFQADSCGLEKNRKRRQKLKKL